MGSPYFQMPAWTTVKVGDQTINTLDPAQMNQLLRNLWSAVYGVSGAQGGGASINSPLDLNSNLVTGVVNSATPAASEALAYGTAQGLYASFRQAVRTVTANATIEPADGTVLASSGPVTVTVTLDSPNFTAGQVVPVKRLPTAALPILVQAGGGAKVEGNPVYTLSASPITAALFQYDGANWWVLAKL